jgi:hypothetical protein
MERLSQLALSALVVLLIGCGSEKPHRETMLCSEFTFRAANGAEVIEARRMMYEAALALRRDYSDTSVNEEAYSQTHAEMKATIGKLVLSGWADWPSMGRPGQNMSVSLFDVPSDAVSTVQCKSPEGEFEKVREIFARRWQVKNSVTSPKSLRPNNSSKPTPLRGAA